MNKTRPITGKKDGVSPCVRANTILMLLLQAGRSAIEEHDQQRRPIT